MRDDTERLKDILVHHYFGIDKEAVWAAVRDDLPKLKTQMRRFLELE